MIDSISLRGDLHAHTTWSDGKASVETMARAAQALGHQYLAITDHSPRLRVANGLSRERLLQQWDEIASVQARADLRLLRGIEVDILASGALDQADDLLTRLDIVVASIHSDLHADPATITRRMITAIANPHTTVLGHCTGRKRRTDGTWRAPSRFDADLVFAACARFGVAVEINSRPDRDDPPDDLLAIALEAGCLFAIDSDAHTTAQLSHLGLGRQRAERLAIPEERIITTWSVERLLEHGSRGR